MQHVLAQRQLNLQKSTTHTSSTKNKTDEALPLFTSSAMVQTRTYKNSGRHTISKASGEIKESHGTIFSRLEAAGNKLLRILGLRSKSIREQNISDVLRLAIDGFANNTIDITTLNKDAALRQLNEIYDAGQKYFDSAQGLGDYTRLMFLSQIISDRIVKFKANDKVLLKLYVDYLKKINPSHAADILENIDYDDAAKILKALKNDALLTAITTHMQEDTVRHLNIFPDTTTATEVRNNFVTDMPTPQKGILKQPDAKQNVKNRISFNSENLATITSIQSKKLKIFTEIPLVSPENASIFENHWF